MPQAHKSPIQRPIDKALQIQLEFFFFSKGVYESSAVSGWTVNNKSGGTTKKKTYAEFKDV